MTKPTASEVLEALRSRGLSLATAESCTGGLIGGALTAVPGSSDTYRGGIISYTNEIKQKLLGVPGETLAQYGAVSAPVAEAMALGAAESLGADVAVSTTGLAGPGGDEYGNPVGTVYLARAYHGQVKCVHCRFGGDRAQVRQGATDRAMELILEIVEETL
ncbi:MAG: CinA family protein [Faecousia sp.]